MRSILRELFKSTFIFEYRLPHSEKSINNSAYTTNKDFCFSAVDNESVSKSIYNGIVDYAKNEYKVDLNNLNNIQRSAIINDIKYTDDASNKTKLKYGFFGEILLYGIIRLFFKTDVLMARGFLYNPLENSETKGYDCFHFIQKANTLDLWFGEVKFYQDYKSGINSVLKNLEKAISDEYFNRNMLALIKYKDSFTNTPQQIKLVCEQIENNPDINIAKIVNDYKMRMVYPIIVLFDTDKRDYDTCVKDCITHIEDEQRSRNLNIKSNVVSSIFFIFIPVDKTKDIKEKVIKWISTKEPLKS